MSLGLGIFLVVVGAILVYALNISVEWMDLDLVGYILMGAGAVVIILGIVLLTRKRTSVSTTRRVDGEQITSEKRSIDDV
ncbi:DUF6458 family protein [Cryobacterium sp. PH31-AA6]|uniref:DUF6458 family protein n=1 Tax=Cryobacterium sp. PH31-AA6 TaxID=3046205 RepID=UPI0024B97D8B|nr:DUF6458 family protein [Cryobacterium sp. PH31-AA6]MDJ0322171.1 DUF6458 family protein [Cryobacterium sp. PH31-AA6]